MVRVDLQFHSKPLTQILIIKHTERSLCVIQLPKLFSTTSRKFYTAGQNFKNVLKLTNTNKDGYLTHAVKIKLSTITLLNTCKLHLFT